MRRFGVALGLGLGVGTVGLLACTGPALPPASPALGGVSARGSLRVQEGPALRPLLVLATPSPGAVLVPFTKSRLSRIEVHLEDLGQALGPQRTHDLLPSQFGNTLTFDSLVEGGSYRVTLKAWQPADLAFPQGNQLEAQADEASSLGFQVPLSTPLVELDALGGLVLTLKDRDAAAVGTGGIVLQPGAIETPAASEALVP